jgi:hypothetical protein
MSLPKIEHSEFQRLDKNATKEALFSTFIFLLPISLAVVIALCFAPDVTSKIVIMVAIALGVFNSFIAWITIRAVANTGIALREHDLLLKRGVFWHKTIAVPFNRIQHIETHRNPAERKLVLSTLKLFTAGGAGADLSISGLKLERASQLRQFILSKTSLQISESE